MENISIVDAAKLMHKDPQFIRIGLQKGILPFGSAIKISEKRYSYYISSKKFFKYVGCNYDKEVFKNGN